MLKRTRARARAPEYAVRAAGEVRVLDERDVLGAAERDPDLVAERRERLSAWGGV